MTQIAGINCAASGSAACLEKRFFYTPSTFSSSNQQFVRDTVREFYLRFAPPSLDAAAVCPQEDESTRELVRQNALLRTRCGSVALESVKDGIQAARRSIDNLMQIVFSVLNIALDFMQLTAQLDGGARDSVFGDLMYWFRKLVADMGDGLRSMGDVLFKIVFDTSPVGRALKEVVKVLCSLVAWLVNNVWNNFMCPMVQVLAPPLINVFTVWLRYMKEIVGVVDSIACSLGGCLNVAGIFDGIIDGLDGFKRSIESGHISCNVDFPGTCFQDDSDEAVVASLPVATRCVVFLHTNTQPHKHTH